MKILAIRICNLASLEGAAEIDFTQEPLATAGIFAITGPTGAGKSTILDALCLALYGKTPRYNTQAESGIEVKNINQSDARGILRDGTAEGSAEVDFLGQDQQQYRATWSVRRAHNRANGKLQAYNITLTNLSTHTEIPGTKSDLLPEIERLVGLSFEQFTRSVLLAQGEFTAFLKAGRDEKSSLLEKLTGTEVYSNISKRVYDRHKEESLKLLDLNTQRLSILTLTPEELAQLEGQRQALTTTLQTLEQRIAQLELETGWYQQLNALQGQLNAAHTQYNKETVIRTAAEPRNKNLQQVERVQEVRTPVENLRTIQLQLTKQQEQQREQKEALERLTDEQEIHSEVVRQAEEQLSANIKEQEDAKPLLDRAKALDVQLGEKQQQVQQADEDRKGVQAKQQHILKNLADREREVKETEEEIDRLTQWKTKFADRQQIAEHESLILARLTDAMSALEAEGQASYQLKELTQQTEALQVAAALNVETRTAIDNELQSARQQYDTIHTALAAMPQQELEEEKTGVDDALQQLTQAAAHWQLVFTAQQEVAHTGKRLETRQQELSNQQQQLAPGQVENARLQKEAAQQILNKARLAATESVEQLREQLVHDEPCPVCGSKEHPYVLDNPQLQHVLTELEKAFHLQEQDYLKQLNTHTRLEAFIQTLTEEITALEKEQNQKQQHADALHSAWVSFAVHAECSNVPDAEKADWLHTRLQQQKDRQQQLQQQLKVLREQQQQAEMQRNERDRLDKQFTKITNEIKDTERTWQSLQDQHGQQDRDLQKAKHTLTGIQTELEKYFNSADWFKTWKDDPKNFTKKIQEFAAGWKTNMQALDELALQQSNSTITLTGLKEQATATAGDLALKQQNFETYTKQYDILKDNRTGLFAGKQVVEVEQALQAGMNSARQKVEESYSRREELRNALTRTTTEKEQNENQITIAQQQQNQLQVQITQWVQQYNETQTEGLTEEILTVLLQFNTSWIDAERSAIRQLDDALTRAETVLKEWQTALDQHRQQRQPEQSAEELQVQLNEAKTENTTLLRQQTEIQVRLRDDVANKERIGDLLQRIETQTQQADHWGKLNEVIGSADGKKFRQVAQEYTLDVLLGFANVHLDVLNQRYVLQRIPNTLGLQVVDRDMGDEVRTVYSLSGGESFLVSLALALGLASISSSRMQVESLFIDEGFGSLDPNTLNIAMDALERLHNQGRKVGVISHVQEMTDRIPVQVKVNKQQSGKSIIDIIGV